MLKNCDGVICELEEIEKYPIEQQIELIKKEKFILKEKLGRVCFFSKKLKTKNIKEKHPTN